MRAPLLLLILLLFASMSCVTTHPREELHRKYAENAVAASDWRLAARLWGELFLEVGDETPVYGRELGRAQLTLGDARAALRTLNATLELFPDELESLTLKASAHLALGDSEAAALALEQRMVRDPAHWQTARALGALRLEQGLPHAAIGPLRAAHERLRESGRKDPELALWLAASADAAGDSAEALDAYIEALDAGRGTIPDLLRASELAAGRDDLRTSRREWLERACARNPQSTAAHLALGNLHVESARTELSLASLRRAVEIDPTDIAALTALAELYAELGDEPNTRALVERALVFEREAEQRAHLEGLVVGVKERAAESGGD